MHEKENLEDRKPTLMQALQMMTPYSLSSPDIPKSFSYIIKFTNSNLKCKSFFRKHTSKSNLERDQT